MIVPVIAPKVPVTATHPVNDVAVLPVYWNTSPLASIATPAFTKPVVDATLTVVESRLVKVKGKEGTWSVYPTTSSGNSNGF